jgi:hypothetical protein
MQGFAERKKEEKKLLEDERKKPPVSHPRVLMSEGPMLIDETKGIEQRARAQHEKSVKIELAAILAGRKRKKGGKRKGRRRKKLKIR